jgi:hypothetical protein
LLKDFIDGYLDEALGRSVCNRYRWRHNLKIVSEFFERETAPSGSSYFMKSADTKKKNKKNKKPTD